MTAATDRQRDLRACGVWGGRTIAQHARELATADPERILVIDGARRLSAAALFREAESLARALRIRGLKTGNVVSYILPNWYETCVLNVAAALAGVVLNPLLPIYRERDLKFMLSDCGSRMLFVPASYRGVDYPELISRIETSVPELRDLVVVRGESRSGLTYDTLLGKTEPVSLPEVDPAGVKLLIYTSGTTGRPKGVLHSHETIIADVRSLALHWGISSRDTFFVPSPVTHIGGSLYAHEFPWYSGTPAVLLDVWSGAEAVRLIDRFGCTIAAGATPFLRDLLSAAAAAGTRLPSLRLFVCGGAAVPPDLIRRAHQDFQGCIACRAYGSTEVPTVTSGTPVEFDPVTCAETDGVACGTEIMIVDPDSGRIASPGMSGEVIVRGPEMFLGYVRPEDDSGAFTSAGYFRTGDLGILDEAGRLTITGRRKDLIIRAGENISPKEVEDILGSHPAVDDIAVVSLPDQDTGEAVCACVVCRPGASITLAQIVEYMVHQGTARQKIPEALMVLDSLPRTATGKVRKDLLRDLARRSAAQLERADRSSRRGSRAS